MIPIQELINRIRWDEQFDVEFVLGYYDRVYRRVERVPLRTVIFPPDEHFIFQLANENGEFHSIPDHRVREVFRNGELIWQRGP